MNQNYRYKPVRRNKLRLYGVATRDDVSTNGVCYRSECIRPLWGHGNMYSVFINVQPLWGWGYPVRRNAWVGLLDAINYVFAGGQYIGWPSAYRGQPMCSIYC